MPEGHALHRLARLHRRRFAGRPVAVSSPQGRFAGGAALVDGRVLVSAGAYGKHLFHRYDPDLVVHVHLGLYGAFSDEPLPAALPRGLVRMRMIGCTHYADRVWTRISRSRAPLATLLMDQSVIAGAVAHL